MITSRLKCLFFVCLLVLPSYSFAQQCKESGEYSSVTIFLLDVTESAGFGENFKNSVNVLDQQLQQKERLLVTYVTDKRANSSVAIDVVKPEVSVWESKLALMKKQKVFKDCVGSIADLPLKIDTKNIHTSAIIETFKFIEEILKQTAVPKKKLVIFSDMIQNSSAINLYKVGPKETVKSLIAKVEAAHLLPNLNGVEIQVAGVGGTQTDVQARFTEEFWRELFTKAGATLKYYGPVLVK